MKKLKYIISISFILFTFISFINYVSAVSKNDISNITGLDTNTLSQIEQDIKEVDVNNISQDEILNLYDTITNTYDTNDIATIIEDNKSVIESQGIDSSLIDSSISILKTTDSKELKEILENNVDINEIKKELESGTKPEKILSNIVSDIPTDKKISIFSKLLFANYIVKVIIISFIILFIYRIILRWIIYNKAGLHGFGAIIPIYNQVLKYRICDISPWIILLWFLPIIGWSILFITAIVMRFVLAANFNKGFFFGLGLLLFPPIFESILAFNSNITYKYLDENEDENE